MPKVKTVAALAMCWGVVGGCGGDRVAGNPDASGSSDGGLTDAGPDPREDAAARDGGERDASVDAAGDGDAGDAAAPDAGRPEWHVEDVGTHRVTEYYTAIALAGGGVHVLYFDPAAPGSQKPQHAISGEDGWDVAPIEEPASAGWWPALAVDPSGTLHAAWHRNDPDYDATYGRFDDGEWRTEAIDGPNNVGWLVQMALDDDGVPHAVYMDDTEDELRFALLDADDGWQTEPVPDSADMGSHDVVLDGSEALVLAGHDDDGIVLFERDAGGSWRRQPLDAERRVSGVSGSLALDATGTLHACYDDYRTGELVYAVREGGEWTVAPLAARDDERGESLPCALAIDSEDRPHVAYIRPRSPRLVHAVLEDGGWGHEDVDSRGRGAVDLVLDEEDRPHISYAASFSESIRIRYATRR